MITSGSRSACAVVGASDAMFSTRAKRIGELREQSVGMLDNIEIPIPKDWRRRCDRKRCVACCWMHVNNVQLEGPGKRRILPRTGQCVAECGIAWGLHTGIVAGRYPKGDLRNVCWHLHQVSEKGCSSVENISASLGLGLQESRISGEDTAISLKCFKI